MFSISDEYPTIVSGAGWADLGTRGRLRFDGKDALSFLQALVSNDVATLTPGQGVYATYLTPQGRMLADLDVYRRPEAVVVSVVPGLGAPLATRFDRLVFSEDVRVTDDSLTTAELVVVGGDAARRIGRALELDDTAVAGLPELAQVGWTGGFVARSGDARLPIFKIFGEASERQSIVARLESAGAVEISGQLVDALRIDVGRPRFGVDMTEETIPLEAGLLDRAISTTKGCYVGQEIIIRVLHRGGGRVAKRLVRLVFDSDTDVLAPGAAIARGEQTVGSLTSVSRAPSDDGWNALGYVQRDAAEIGNEVTVAGSAFGKITGFAG